jgi:hypothetical protein
MGPEDDYAEPGSSRWSPLPDVALWVVIGILLLAIFGPALFLAML